jgi:uncharacterized membrane protein YtjA (UPF0391 family)
MARRPTIWHAVPVSHATGGAFRHRVRWYFFIRSKFKKESIVMLKGAVIFAILALVLGVLGFTGIAGAAWGIAKILFWIAVIIAVALAVLGFTIYKKVT